MKHSEHSARKSLFVPMWLVRLISSMAFTVLPLYLAENQVSAAMIGLILGLHGYAALVIDLVAATFIDNVKKSGLLKIGVLGVSVFCLGYAIGPRYIAYFAVLQILLGFSLGSIRPAANALVAEFATPKKTGSALGLHNVAYILGGSTGPLLAMALANYLSFRSVLFIAGGIGLGLLTLLHFTLPDCPPPRPVHRILKKHLRSLWDMVIRRGLALPMCFLLADILILRMWLTYLPLFGARTLGLSTLQLGTILSVESMAYVIGQPLWGRLTDRIGVRIPLLIGLASPAIIAVTPFSTSFAFLLVVYTLMGFLNSAAYPAYTSLAVRLVGKSEYGKAMSLMAASSDLGNIIGPLAGAIIIQLCGKMDYLFVLPVPVAVLAAALVLIPTELGRQGGLLSRKSATASGRGATRQQ